MSAPLSPRIDAFLISGLATCTHHGEHDRWSLRERSKGSGKPYRALECKDCRKAQKANWDQRNPHYMRDWLRANPQVAERRRVSLQGRASLMVAGARQRAQAAGRECSITAEWLVQQWQQQRGLCAYTDRPLNLDAEPRDASCPSLDRYDPTLGYTVANTRLVCWGVNHLKGNLSPEDFFEMCAAVALKAR